MTFSLNLNLERVQDGQYYLKGTRLDFDLPYAIYIVNGDKYIPYYRVHINGKLAAIVDYERQAEEFLLKLTKAQAHVFAITEKQQTFKSFAVVFQNTDNKKVSVDIFTAKSATEARGDFKECYRHGNYKIISTTEIPE